MAEQVDGLGAGASDDEAGVDQLVVAEAPGMQVLDEPSFTAVGGSADDRSTLCGLQGRDVNSAAVQIGNACVMECPIGVVAPRRRKSGQNLFSGVRSGSGRSTGSRAVPPATW